MMNIFKNILFPNNLFTLHNMKISCWSCNKEIQKQVPNLFCSHCKVLQKPDEKSNHFQIMGLEESYDIDDTYLSKKYKELQRYLHPDKFANK